MVGCRPAGLDAGTWTAEQMAQVALDSFAVAQRTDRVEPADSVRTLSRPFADPLRRHDPISDGAAAVGFRRPRPASCGNGRPDHRIRTPHRDAPIPGARDLTTSPSTAASAAAAWRGRGSIEIAELHAPFTHQQLILTEAIGLFVDPWINRRAARWRQIRCSRPGWNGSALPPNIFDGSAQRTLAACTSGPSVAAEPGCGSEGPGRAR